MKIVLVIALMCALSALVMARDLAGIARKERARRQEAVAARQGRKARFFSNADLKPHGSGVSSPRSTSAPESLRTSESSRDLAREREYWRREKESHRRELARLDARIRRLEWRLAERKSREQPGERLHEDAAESALAESLESMRSERERLVQAFLERGRKAGALPGWLR